MLDAIVLNAIKPAIGRCDMYTYMHDYGIRPRFEFDEERTLEGET